MKGRKVVLDIIDTGNDGQGVAKLDGKTIFLSSVIVGEKVEAILYQEKKNIGFAKVIKVLTPAPTRITPLCPVFFKCGGCDLQHIEYQEQLNIKQYDVLTTLGKQVKKDFVVEKVIASDKAFGYRNKAQLPVGISDGKVVVGFYKPKSHDLIPLTTCPLQENWLDKIIDSFTNYANDNNISVYNEHTQKGLLRHLVVRKINNKFAIVVVINGKSLPNYNNFLNNILTHFDKNDVSLYVNINTKKTNVIMGQENILLFGNDGISTSVLGINVTISPHSFFQVNDYIAKRIYQKVVDIVAGPENVVIDAYSGAGLLTALLAKKSHSTIGVEIVKEAVDNANKLIKDNNITNVKNYCGDAKDIVPSLVNDLIKNNVKPIIVLDPPRKGCDKAVLDAVLLANPQEIVYVSCSPASLARDLAILTNDTNYEISLVQPYDMFPQTKHIETLVHLVKK